ncbi:type IX secretion system membrane protein PorP/SprF [Maribacter polysaccharolyticus]|uniref:PorP/SprF family type IX secretion system membrane protein n=1 Tax=Maribacter polysaccharolyticus TaxID=3020831 RepID=UPI00237FCF6D|nr:type IX secretion system membrane protein PorP/SprF [Maribacter polysaccharolyticus]MDE3740565.1 type IX secretion system membrane protein PorP/SprF [Maribacter polysaccharolyticus]
MKSPRKKSIKLLALFLLFSGGRLLAQQLPQYTQYMYNTSTINPAYVNENNRLDATITYRAQWVGIDGAPETKALTITGIINNRMGLGLNLFKDNIGPSTEFNSNAVLFYYLNLSKKVKMSLGINAGVDFFEVDYSKGSYYDQDDVLFSYDNYYNALPAIGAGIYIFNDNWYVGFSVPNLLLNKSNVVGDTNLIQRDNHMYFIGGYVVAINSATKLKPSILVKTIANAPATIDASLNVLFMQKFTLGVSHRFKDSFSAMAGFQISKNFFLGYSYDYSTSDLGDYNRGSHEIILKYLMPRWGPNARSPRFF